MPTAAVKKQTARRAPMAALCLAALAYAGFAAAAAGADGLIIEVHPCPECAWSDGAQSLKPERFAEVVRKARAIAHVVGREMR